MTPPPQLRTFNFQVVPGSLLACLQSMTERPGQALTFICEASTF